MARFPGATWRPIPENATQAAIIPTQLIFHTAVDSPGHTDLPAYFGRPDVKEESHFWVATDGSVDQLMDTLVRADANRHANVRAISVETEDDGDPSRPWTPGQLVTLRDLALWAHAIHAVPLRPCPAWDAPGLGYHSMFGFRDNRALTGAIDNPWSPSLGKVCPGPVRVRQFWDVLLPSITSNQEAAMAMTATAAETKVRTVYRALLQREPSAAEVAPWVAGLVKGQTLEGFLWSFLEAASPEIAGGRAQLNSLSATVAALQADVTALKAKAPTAAPADVDAVLAALAARLTR